MTPKHFTRQEAEALLPTVEPLLKDIQRWRGELESLAERLAEQRARSLGNGHTRSADEDNPQVAAHELELRIRASVEQILALGIEVKDLETGLIDFPALRDGRTVYLCWRLGEDRIAWWHEVDAGFAGRTPLEEEDTSYD